MTNKINHTLFCEFIDILLIFSKLLYFSVKEASIQNLVPNTWQIACHSKDFRLLL